MFIDIGCGVIQLILHMPAIPAGAAHAVGIALCANCQNDVRRAPSAAIRRSDGKITLCSRNAGNLGIMRDVERAGLFVPPAKDRFALTRLKINIRSQLKLHRRRHDMFALLIFIDGIRQMIRLFDQQIG